jgi:hypothetical protein
VKFQPAGLSPKQTVYPRFVEQHRRLRAWMLEADGLDLWKNRLVSPAARLIRLSLGETFALLLAHLRRHVWQVRQISPAPSPPA